MIAYQQVPSPNFGYPRGTHGQNRPRALVWHITASSPTSPPLAGLDSWFTNPEAGATQLGIQDSEVHQYVQFEDAAWHAGYLANPDISNPHVYRWVNENINPNFETIGIEVVAQPGPGDVPRGTHRLNDATWETMQAVGLDLVERYPTIELVEIDWLGHWQNDGVNRARDPKTVYWPADILADIRAALEPPEEDDMTTYRLFQTWVPAKTWIIAYVSDVPIYRRWLVTPEGVDKLRATLGEPETISEGQLATIPKL